MTARYSLRPWTGAALLGGVALAMLPATAAAENALQTPITFVDRFLVLLLNPNVAYILFVAGLLGLVAELVTAGTVFPGVVGTISLILSLIGLVQLPTNWGGAALILAGIVMFLLDLKITGYGLTVGAMVAFGLGSLLLFTPFWMPLPLLPEATDVRLNPWLVLATTVGVTAFFLLGLAAAVRAHFVPVAMGRETMIGKVGTVRRPLTPTGIVHLEGEEWSALLADGDELPAGTAVRVVGADGLTLRVERVS
jgi:membrane-bound serine protease (ClpP class)